MKAYFIILVLLGVSIIPVFAMPGFQPVYQSPSLANGSPPTELYCTLGQFLNSYNSTTNSFTCLAGGGGGENNTASNVGLGEDIFKQKTGVDLEFKGIAVSGDLSISSNLTDITISYTGGTGNVTILNDAGDVVLTSPAYPSILFYNGLQWIDKIFSINSLSSANDIFVTGINNQTGTITTNQFSVNTITCSGTDKVSAIKTVTCTVDQSGGISDGDKGDITVSGSGATWTVDTDVVTYAKMQNVASDDRFLGRISGANGDTEELTGTQATTLLDVFTSALKGLAPASGGGTTNFLRADGTWAVPGGGSTPRGGYLMSHWTMSQTKSNIGTSFVNVYPQTNSNGKAILIDTDAFTTARLYVQWNKIGTGTQTCQVINGATVLVSTNVVSGSNDSGFDAIPAGLLNTENAFRIQCKSTTSTDDPIFESASIWMK